MAKENKNLPSTEVNEATLALLRESYPVEHGGTRIMLPRITMASQDVTEGKGKSMKVVTEAGTFFIEKPTDEEDENGKKVWSREEIGNSIQGIIVFQRKQLRLYNEATEQYTSSPVYDSDDEIVPLFCDKAEVARGTPAELKAQYQYVDKDGKTKSKLEDNRILYVQYDGEIYQMNLRGSSMYSFLTYARKTIPPAVVTTFSSEPKEKGSISWNQMTFVPERKLTQAEAENIVLKIGEIKELVRQERSQFSAPKTETIRATVEDSETEKQFKDF